LLRLSNAIPLCTRPGSASLAVLLLAHPWDWKGSMKLLPRLAPPPIFGPMLRPPARTMNLGRSRNHSWPWSNVSKHSIRTTLYSQHSNAHWTFYAYHWA